MTLGGIDVLVALQGRVDRATVQTVLSSQPGVRPAGFIADDQAWASRGEHSADALLIVCAAPSDDVLSLIEQEKALLAPMPVLVVCGSSPNGFVHRVLEAGADDFLLVPDITTAGPQIHFAIEKALTPRGAPAGGPSAVEGGEIVCVLGPKGGTGKTLTASNLSVALRQLGKRVALVDLDLQFGDLGLVMGLRPERSVFDLVTSGGSLDAPKLDAFLTRHGSGVQVLLAPTRPDQATAITPEFLRELYAVMREHFDYVVVDTPPGFTAEVIATIDVAGAVCLIGTLDAPSLKNAKLGAETLELMGYPADRIRVVLNRADSKVGVSHADVVTVLGRAPDVLIPSSREVVRSVNSGEPIVIANPRSEAAKAFEALATMFVRASGPQEIPTVVPRRGFRAGARA